MSTYLTALAPTLSLARFTPLFLHLGFDVARLEAISLEDIDGLVGIAMDALRSEAVSEKKEVSGIDKLDLGTSFGNALRRRLKG